MKNKNKDYIISLSMGHDTDLHWEFNYVKAKSINEALNKLWKEITMFSSDKIEKIYKIKGVRYFPYYFVHKQ